MKRDWDVIREILLGFVDQKEPVVWVSDIEADEHGVTYGFHSKNKDAHFKLLLESGLVAEEFDVDAAEGRQLFGYRLTWKGHELADTLQDEGIWARTKEIVSETGGIAAVELVKAIAIGLVKKQLSKHADLEI